MHLVCNDLDMRTTQICVHLLKLYMKLTTVFPKLILLHKQIMIAGYKEDYDIAKCCFLTQNQSIIILSDLMTFASSYNITANQPHCSRIVATL